MTVEPSPAGSTEHRISRPTPRSLDDTLGALLSPSKVDDAEKKQNPRSLQRLNFSTAELLRTVMKATEDGLGVTQFVYCELPILWIADSLGEIWFALEEIVDAETHEFMMPRIRNTTVAENCYRLGHPALLLGEAKDARIAGEILFDVRASSPAWYITNGSGRYGTREGRLLEHLLTAKQKFQDHGISLKHIFFEQRSQ